MKKIWFIVLMGVIVLFGCKSKEDPKESSSIVDATEPYSEKTVGNWSMTREDNFLTKEYWYKAVDGTYYFCVVRNLSEIEVLVQGTAKGYDRNGNVLEEEYGCIEMLAPGEESIMMIQLSKEDIERVECERQYSAALNTSYSPFLSKIILSKEFGRREDRKTALLTYLSTSAVDQLSLYALFFNEKNELVDHYCCEITSEIGKPVNGSILAVPLYAKEAYDHVQLYMAGCSRGLNTRVLREVSDQDFTTREFSYLDEEGVCTYYLAVKNNSSIPTFINGTMIAYDKNGKMIDAQSDYKIYSLTNPGEETCLKFVFRDGEMIDHVESDLLYTNDTLFTAAPKQDSIEVQKKIDAHSVTVTLSRNGDEIPDSLLLDALFFDSEGKVVWKEDIELNYYSSFIECFDRWFEVLFTNGSVYTKQFFVPPSFASMEVFLRCEYKDYTEKASPKIIVEEDEIINAGYWLQTEEDTYYVFTVHNRSNAVIWAQGSLVVSDVAGNRFSETQDIGWILPGETGIAYSQIYDFKISEIDQEHCDLSYYTKADSFNLSETLRVEEVERNENTLLVKVTNDSMYEIRTGLINALFLDKENKAVSMDQGVVEEKSTFVGPEGELLNHSYSLLQSGGVSYVRLTSACDYDHVLLYLRKSLDTYNGNILQNATDKEFLVKEYRSVEESDTHRYYCEVKSITQDPALVFGRLTAYDTEGRIIDMVNAMHRFIAPGEEDIFCFALDKGKEIGRVEYDLKYTKDATGRSVRNELDIEQTIRTDSVEITAVNKGLLRLNNVVGSALFLDENGQVVWFAQKEMKDPEAYYFEPGDRGSIILTCPKAFDTVKVFIRE